MPMFWASCRSSDWVFGKAFRRWKMRRRAARGLRGSLTAFDEFAVLAGSLCKVARRLCKNCGLTDEEQGGQHAISHRRSSTTEETASRRIPGNVFAKPRQFLDVPPANKNLSIKSNTSHRSAVY
jgi:hypothetical protein